KANFQVDALERFPDLLRQAFRVATSAAPGPVHLELSGTHAQVLEREAELTPLWEERFMKVPAFRPEPEPDAVRAAMQVLAQAALVCFIGSHAGGQVTTNWQVPKPGVAAIQLDIDPEELGRNYPLKAALLGDAKVTLHKLIAAVGSAAPRREWLGRVQRLVREYREESDQTRSSDAVPIRPERICKEISEWLPEGGVVLSDTGHSGMWTGQMIRLTRPGQRFIRCAGSLGWGFPATLGAKCALPDRPVIGFCGDGGFYYHLAELETAARFNISAIMLVNNNYALNQEKHLFDSAYKGQQRGRAKEMWHFSHAVSFARVAE